MIIDVWQVPKYANEVLLTITQRCSVKKVFLNILQNSQENTCARASFSIKLQALWLQLYLKKDFGTSVFL